MLQEPLIYIVILNYNGFTDTFECVKSLENITYNNFKLVIVDNCSTDDSYEKLKKTFPNYKVIETYDNLGYAGGNNFGVKYVMKQNPEYILILNNDIIVDKNFLSNMLQSIDTDNIGVLSPKVYFYKTKIINSFGAKKTLLNTIKNNYEGIDEDLSIILDKNDYVKYVMGCCMLIKKEVIREFGLFDEKYFMYLEESDFCHRINKSYKIKVISNSIIWHKNGSSTKTTGLNYFTTYYYRRNSLYFISKNFSLFRLIFSSMLFILKDSFYTIKYRDISYLKVLLWAWKDFFSKRLGKNNNILNLIIDVRQ